MVGCASCWTDKCLTVIHSIVSVSRHNWQIRDGIIGCPEVMMNDRTYGLNITALMTNKLFALKYTCNMTKDGQCLMT